MLEAGGLSLKFYNLATWRLEARGCWALAIVACTLEDRELGSGSWKVGEWRLGWQNSSIHSNSDSCCCTLSCYVGVTRTRRRKSRGNRREGGGKVGTSAQWGVKGCRSMRANACCETRTCALVSGMSWIRKASEIVHGAIEQLQASG